MMGIYCSNGNTFFFFRFSKDTDWITYEGVVTDTALINLANHQSNEQDHNKDGSIVSN